MAEMIMTMNDEEFKLSLKCLSYISIFVIIIGAIIMIIFGSICIDKEVYDLCVNTIGARLLLIFGILIIMCCCFGGYVRIMQKKKLNKTIADVYKKIDGL